MSLKKNYFENIKFWDLKSFLWVILFLALLFSLLFYFKDFRSNARARKLNALTKETKAKILSVKGIEMMSQSRKGTRIYIDRYQIDYIYTVSGITFYGNDELINSQENSTLLEKLTLHKKTEFFRIKYDPNNPTKSAIFY